MLGVDAVILAGGRGSRLSGALPGVAKVLAPVKGRPFLDYVLDFLVAQGVARIVVSVGHLQEQVVRRYHDFRSVPLRFSREDVPLGTGGAVRRALEQVRSDPFIALNGDSLCHVELQRLVALHAEHRAQATVVLARLDARSDVGNVWLNSESRVIAFAEKSAGDTGKTGERFMNAGIYAFRQSAFSDFSAVSFSLEHDLLPRLVESRGCYGLVAPGAIIDIGTPDRYAQAQSLL
jgi:NDP-sugar pyrophosphorylase family protein